MPPHRAIQNGLIALIALCASFGSCGAEVYPSRPITMIVPFPVGGPIDSVARMLAERMRVSLGQPVIIENVAGAAGSIAMGKLARAQSDGYTIAIGNNGTNVLNGALYRLQYDLTNNFVPIALVAHYPQLFLANKKVPADDFAGLIRWLKANPDTALQGTSGAGSTGHVAGAFFQEATGTHYQFVAYHGLAPAMQGLLAGEVDIMVGAPADSLSQITAGTIKAYAVLAKNRLPSAPEIPTSDEAGMAGFHAPVWYATWAPKGTSSGIIAKLNAAVTGALADATVRTRMSNLSFEMYPSDEQTPEALAALQKTEIEKWWPIVKAMNIKTE